MKPRKHRFLIALAAILLSLVALPATALGSTAGTEAHQEPRQPCTAEVVVAAMQPGWDVGNTLDAVPDETSWGNPRITPELLAAIHDEGVNSVRLPVTWTDHQGGAPDPTIEPAYLDGGHEVVNKALAEGLYGLLDVHHDSWQWVRNMPTQHDQVLARYTATWTQIARTFRDAPPELLFESINEPQFTGGSGETQEYALLDELNTTFHSIVCGSGGTNAGPHNWTAYKEYGRTFTPNYAAGQITPKQDFFTDVNDNRTVTLTFLFRSGETLPHTLTRAGTTVAGTTA